MCNYRHPGPRRGEPRVGSAPHVAFPLDPLDPADPVQNSQRAPMTVKKQYTGTFFRENEAHIALKGPAAPRRPKNPQDGPRSPQDRPTTAPRRPKSGPRLFQDAPRLLQDAPRQPQDAPRRPQDGFKTYISTNSRSTALTAAASNNNNSLREFV